MISEHAEGTRVPDNEMVQRWRTGARTLSADTRQEDKLRPVRGRRTYSGVRRMRMCHQGSLDNEHPVVVFIGCNEIRGQWISLAMGVDLTGIRSVLGVWKGFTSDPGCCRAVTSSLRERGLSGPFLLVTDGSSVLDQAVGESSSGVALAHCQKHLRKAVLAHLPKEAHDDVSRKLEEIFDASPQQDKERLGSMVEDLRIKHPGAAARLQRSWQKSLTVLSLNTLRRHVSTIACIDTAFRNAFRECSTADVGVERVIRGLENVRARRIAGYRDSPALSKEPKIRMGPASGPKERI